MKKQVITFIESLLKIFAVIILIFAITTLLIGKEAKSFPNLFMSGNKAISLKTLFQLFTFSFLISLLRFVFFTDVFLKKTGLILRYIFFFILTIVIFVIIALICHWIPKRPIIWILVLASYSLSTVISILVTHFFTKKEDEKLNDALAKIQKRSEY
jgi:hypothetical protein